jgi:hypothetical protein
VRQNRFWQHWSQISQLSKPVTHRSSCVAVTRSG